MSTTTLSLWIDSLRSHRSNLMRDAFQYWYDYCVRVETPSTDLQAALNDIDPYCVLATSLYYDFYYQDINTWQMVIKWAKPFKIADSFVKKVNTYIQGFSVTFPADMSRREALWRTVEIQEKFSDNPASSLLLNSVNRRDERLSALYQELYGLGKRYTRRGIVLVVLPDDKENRVALPVDWVTVRISKDNGNVMQKVHRLLCLNANSKRSLLDDVREDTWRSMTPGLLEIDDLIRLKALTKTYWELFVSEGDSSSSPFSNPTYGKASKTVPVPKFSFSRWSSHLLSYCPSRNESRYKGTT